MNYKIISALLLTMLSLHANADAIRSVDKDGNVTFSDAPVPDSVESETISIDAPPPPQERMTESQREAQATINKANRSQQQQDAASQAKEMENTSAQQDLDTARRQLEESKVVGEGDRQGKAGGGTRLTPEYHERVKRAEQAVKDAEQQ
jgi:type IV secretory pathway VirB10-like protein